MPRKKAEKPLHVERVKGALVDNSPLPPSPASDLIGEYVRNDDWIAAQDKAYGEHMKPMRDRQEAIKQQLHEKLLAEGGKDASFKTDHGTAYISNIMNTKIDVDAAPFTNADQTISRGREAVLDFCLNNWDEIGNEMLQIGVTKDAVKQWIEKTGAPPPGVSISHFARVNIRRS